MTQYFGLGTFIPVQGTTVQSQGTGFDQIGGQYIISGTPGQACLTTTPSGHTYLGQLGSWNHVGGSQLGAIGGQLGYLTPSYGLGTGVGEWSHGVPTGGTTISFIPTGSTNQIGGFQSPWGTSVSVGQYGQSQGNQSINQGINQGWGQQSLGVSTGSIQPSFATEIGETSNEYVLSFDVPGIELNNIDISLDGNILYINGIRTGLQDSSTLSYSEVARGNISRALTLPFNVSSQKGINTSLENGVLKIRISKEDQTGKRNTTRKIQIG